MIGLLYKQTVCHSERVQKEQQQEVLRRTNSCLCGKFLLALASTIILNSESRGNHDHILLSHDSVSLHIKYMIRHGQYRKHRVQQFLYCCVCICCRRNVSTEPLPSNGRLFWLRYSNLLGGGHIDTRSYNSKAIS
jgi:hypothetical protein